MRRRLFIGVIAAALGLSACEDDTPLGNVDDFEGRYEGTWTLSWETNNPLVNPPGETSFCPGSITLGDHFRGTFNGAFLILDEDDCADGSPVSGQVVDGRVRVDGGVNFTMIVPPTLGQEKPEDDIWEDVFAGSGVILPDLIIGCIIVDSDNQMTGAALGDRLAASASASVSCPDPPADLESVAVQLQVRFEGNR